MCCWCGIAERDAQDLEVEALLVAHLEAADRPRPDVAAGERGLVDDQQRVGVVAVAGARALDEAVVEVVEDRRRQHAIQPVDAGDLVVLVLVAAPARDLDHDLDDVRERPGTLHAGSLVARRPPTRGLAARLAVTRFTRTPRGPSPSLHLAPAFAQVHARSCELRDYQAQWGWPAGRGEVVPGQGGAEHRSERSPSCVSEETQAPTRRRRRISRRPSRCRGVPR